MTVAAERLKNSARDLFVCASRIADICVRFWFLGKKRRDPRAEDGAPHALEQQQYGQHEGQEC